MKMCSLNLVFSIITAGITAVGAEQTSPTQPSPAVAPASTNQTKPKIQFESLIHDFGKITGGEQVKCNFVFTNIGASVLEVTDVRPGCGCTTAGEWTRRVEPGKTGTIPLQFNSGSFNGQVIKTATVTCNDPGQPNMTLQLKANIWRAIEVTPQYAILSLTTENPSNAATVRIINNLDTPLTLSDVESKNPAFAASLTTNQPGKEYHLLVKTVPPFPTAQVNGQITIKTSSTNMPVINVTAWATVQHTVTAMPAQLMLPAGPLTTNLTQTVTIHNNGTNPIALTEPAINAEGVEVKIKPFIPGKHFTVDANFPKGFQAGQGTALTIKCDHPKYPLLKVPVYQPQVVPPVMPATHAAPRPASH